MTDQTKYNKHKHSIYIEPELWAKIKEGAEKGGQNISEYITSAVFAFYKWRSNRTVNCVHCNSDNKINSKEKCWFCKKRLTKDS